MQKYVDSRGPFVRLEGLQGLHWQGTTAKEQESSNPANDGKVWEKYMLNQLTNKWAAGDTLAELATALARRPSAIISRLKTIGLISRESYDSPYLVTPHGYVLRQQHLDNVIGAKAPATFNTDTYAFTTSTKEIDMTTNAPTIENRTFIDGTDATQVSDDQIINRLVKLASAAADIEKVLPWLPNGEAREVLIRRQQGLKAGLVELSGYFDDRKSSEAAQAVAAN